MISFFSLLFVLFWSRLFKTDGEQALRQCRELLDESEIETAVRIGDIYAVMVDHYAQQSDANQVGPLLCFIFFCVHECEQWSTMYFEVCREAAPEFICTSVLKQGIIYNSLQSSELRTSTVFCALVVMSSHYDLTESCVMPR